MKLTPPVGGTRPEVTSPRCGSPLVGCSILITSAPQSASTAPAAGTNHHCATSTTRTPVRTSLIRRSLPRPAAGPPALSAAGVVARRIFPAATDQGLVRTRGLPARGEELHDDGAHDALPGAARRIEVRGGGPRTTAHGAGAR